MSPIIGLDLGGTKVALATLCERELSESVVEPTELAGSKALIEQLVRMIESARSEPLEGVGVGFRRWSSSRKEGWCPPRTFRSPMCHSVGS